MNFKKTGCCVLLIWLAVTVLTCIIIPAFQKPSPDPRRPEANGPRPQEYVKIVDSNREAMVRRLQIIESSREELILSTYYLGNDEAGQDVMAAIMAASQRGVHVRILVDGFCAFTSGLVKTDSLQALAARPNVEIKIYNPMHILFPAKNNYRMHDKYLMADDRVFILGGRNTRNKSIGEYEGKPDTDRDALVYCDGEGGASQQLRTYFDAVWALKESKPVKPGDPEKNPPDLLMARYATLGDTYPDLSEKSGFPGILTPVNRVDLLVNPIEARNKAPLLWSQLQAVMEQGNTIQIQTPYVILNKMMSESLSRLAETRQVSILTNAPESGANPMGCADLLNNRKKLLKMGLQLWEYAADKSAHVKTVLVDEDMSLVGSFNFDMRSAYLDTETMLAIDSPEINQSLRKVNDLYLSSSRCLTYGNDPVMGEKFTVPQMGMGKKLFYGVLRIMILPLRHLL